MFASISHRYDLLNHLLSGYVDRWWRRRTVRALLPFGHRVLDLCAGTADLAIEFLRAAPGPLHVTAADFCRPMLQLAQKKLRREPGGRTTLLVEADAQRLPFRDDSFDTVAVAFGLRNVTNYERGLQEMVRVLRPGGKLAVLEFSLPARAVWRRLYLLYFRFVLPVIGQTLARNRFGAYEYLPASVLQFPEGEDMVRLLENCGLASVRLFPMTFGIVTLYWGYKPESPVLLEKPSNLAEPADKRRQPTYAGQTIATKPSQTELLLSRPNR
jgi:demethylmenaquinone methyltransferase/2-methoxy-6-polyprenyl-1,4-benzoquinol methylase